MEKTVSLIGANEGNIGNVGIFKDVDLSSKSNYVPNKPSLSRAHAMKFFLQNIHVILQIQGHYIFILSILRRTTEPWTSKEGLTRTMEGLGQLMTILQWP